MEYHLFQYIRNVKEISCVLGTGNAHEIVPYTVSGNFQEMCKFHVVRNVHTMNKKCDLSYTFLGISQPRKFKISSSAYQANHSCPCYNYYMHYSLDVRKFCILILLPVSCSYNHIFLKIQFRKSLWIILFHPSFLLSTIYPTLKQLTTNLIDLSLLDNFKKYTS